MAKIDSRLVRIAATALRVGRRSMAPYAHPKSPQRFTQPQLLACLVLKANTKSTYRGIIELLEVSPPLRKALGLSQLPHYTTLQKFAASPGLANVLDRALAETVLELNGGQPLKDTDAAIDATGMETGCASAHYRTRSGREYTKWIRVSAVAACASVIPVAMHVDWGPGNDAGPAIAVLEKAAKVMQPDRLWGDAAYDSEKIHVFCHEQWNTTSYAPLINRRNSDVVRGQYRTRMRRKPQGYGRRWTVESMFSAVKRTCGSTLNSRTERTLKTEAALRVVAYGIRRRRPRMT